MSVRIVAGYAGLFGLAYVMLALWVVRARQEHRVALEGWSEAPAARLAAERQQWRAVGEATAFDGAVAGPVGH